MGIQKFCKSRFAFIQVIQKKNPRVNPWLVIFLIVTQLLAPMSSDLSGIAIADEVSPTQVRSEDLLGVARPIGESSQALGNANANIENRNAVLDLVQNNTPTPVTQTPRPTEESVDSQGRRVTRQYGNPDGTVLVSTFNSSNFLIEERSLDNLNRVTRLSLFNGSRSSRRTEATDFTYHGNTQVVRAETVLVANDLNKIKSRKSFNESGAHLSDERFNSSGIRTTQTFFRDGTTTIQRIVQYHPSGIQIRTDEVFSENGKIKTTFSLEGVKTREQEFNAAGFETRRTDFSDSTGVKTAETLFDAAGKKLSSTTFDATTGIKIVEKEFNAAEIEIRRTTFSASTGFRTSERLSDATGKKLSNTTFDATTGAKTREQEFNSAEIEVRRTDFSASTGVKISETLFDETGKKLSTTTFDPITGTKIREDVFDAAGRPFRITTFDPITGFRVLEVSHVYAAATGSKKTTTTINFDSQGNPPTATPLSAVAPVPPTEPVSSVQETVVVSPVVPSVTASPAPNVTPTETQVREAVVVQNTTLTPVPSPPSEPILAPIVVPTEVQVMAPEETRAPQDRANTPIETAQNLEAVRNTEPTVQTPELLARASYLQQIQQQFGSDYDVTLQVSTVDPTKIDVTVRNKPNVILANGRVKSLTYTAQSIEGANYVILTNTISVIVQGVLLTFNGEAIYRALALLPIDRNMDPIARLSQISLLYISINQYRFLDAGKVWDINLSFTASRPGQLSTLNTITLTEAPIPAYVQSYIQNLQTQVGPNFVAVSPTLNPSNDYKVTITAQGDAPEGRLRSLTYTAVFNPIEAGAVTILTATIAATISGGTNRLDITQLNEEVVLNGLKKLPGNLDPIASFCRATFTSINNSTDRYGFVLDSSSWVISREGSRTLNPLLIAISNPTVEANLRNAMEARNDLEVVRNTEPITQAPEMARTSYIQQIQDQFGSDYNVTFQVSPTDPTKINVLVRNKPEIVVANGKVKSLTYIAQSIGGAAYTVLANTVQITVRGVTDVFIGEAIYRGLALLPSDGNTDPIARLSQISLRQVNINQYRFLDADKAWNINLFYRDIPNQPLTLRAVTLTEVAIPAHVQSYIQNLQTQVDPSYIVAVSPILNSNDNYNITIKAQGNAPEGRLRSLTYTATFNPSGTGTTTIVTATITAVISRGPDNPDITQLNEEIVLNGLKKLPGNPDPIISFSRATFPSFDNSIGRYDFVLDGSSWVISLAGGSILSPRLVSVSNSGTTTNSSETAPPTPNIVPTETLARLLERARAEENIASENLRLAELSGTQSARVVAFVRLRDAQIATQQAHRAFILEQIRGQIQDLRASVNAQIFTAAPPTPAERADHVANQVVRLATTLANETIARATNLQDTFNAEIAVAQEAIRQANLNFSETMVHINNESLQAVDTANQTRLETVNAANLILSQNLATIDEAYGLEATNPYEIHESTLASISSSVPPLNERDTINARQQASNDLNTALRAAETTRNAARVNARASASNAIAAAQTAERSALAAARDTRITLITSAREALAEAILLARHSLENVLPAAPQVTPPTTVTQPLTTAPVVPVIQLATPQTPTAPSPVITSTASTRANYLSEIQQQFGSEYNVTLQVSTVDPTKIDVTIEAKSGVTIATGKIRRLRYTVQSLEGSSFRVLENTVAVIVEGVKQRNNGISNPSANLIDVTFNGEALYRGLALLPGNVNPITKLSQITLGYIDRNEFDRFASDRYRFVDAGKFWDIDLSLIPSRLGQLDFTLGTVILIEVTIPANVQTYIQNLQTQLGPGYVAEVSPNLNFDYSRTVTLTAQGSVPEGRLKSLSYSIVSGPSGTGMITIAGTITAVISGGANNPDVTPLNGRILFNGLKKLPGNLDPITSFTRVTFTSFNDSIRRYDFVLDGSFWTISLENPDILLSETVNLTYSPSAPVRPANAFPIEPLFRLDLMSANDQIGPAELAARTAADAAREAQREAIESVNLARLAVQNATTDNDRAVAETALENATSQELETRSRVEATRLAEAQFRVARTLARLENERRAREARINAQIEDNRNRFLAAVAEARASVNAAILAARTRVPAPLTPTEIASGAATRAVHEATNRANPTIRTTEQLISRDLPETVVAENTAIDATLELFLAVGEEDINPRFFSQIESDARKAQKTAHQAAQAARDEARALAHNIRLESLAAAERALGMITETALQVRDQIISDANEYLRQANAALQAALQATDQAIREARVAASDAQHARRLALIEANGRNLNLEEVARTAAEYNLELKAIGEIHGPAKTAAREAYEAAKQFTRLIIESARQTSLETINSARTARNNASKVALQEETIAYAVAEDEKNNARAIADATLGGVLKVSGYARAVDRLFRENRNTRTGVRIDFSPQVRAATLREAIAAGRLEQNTAANPSTSSPLETTLATARERIRTANQTFLETEAAANQAFRQAITAADEALRETRTAAIQVESEANATADEIRRRERLAFGAGANELFKSLSAQIIAAAGEAEGLERQIVFQRLPEGLGDPIRDALAREEAVVDAAYDVAFRNASIVLRNVIDQAEMVRNSAIATASEARIIMITSAREALASIILSAIEPLQNAINERNSQIRSTTAAGQSAAIAAIQRVVDSARTAAASPIIYDDQNRPVLVKRFTRQGYLIDTVETQYHGNTNIASSIITNGYQGFRTILFQDTQGNPISSQRRDSVPGVNTTPIFNVSGFLTEQRTIDGFGRVVSRVLYDGQRTQTRTSVLEFTYHDTASRITRVISNEIILDSTTFIRQSVKNFSSAGVHLSTTTFNASGTRTAETFFRDGTTTIQSVVAFNLSGTRTTETFFRDGTTVAERIVRYNSAGTQIQTDEVFNENGGNVKTTFSSSGARTLEEEFERFGTTLRLLRSVTFSASTGLKMREIFYSYDSQNRQTSRTVNFNNQGNPR